MQRIDYELGLATHEEDFSGADGLGAAKAVLIACNTGCSMTHPFTKSKRNSCKAKCGAIFCSFFSY